MPFDSLRPATIASCPGRCPVTTLERLGRSRPPYLLATGTDRRGVSVGVTADPSATVVEMTVHGRWSRQLHGQVAETLRLCLAGPAAAIVVDLRDLHDPHGAGLPFWVSAVRAAGVRPVPVQLALCPPPGTMLDYRLRHCEGHQPLLCTGVQEGRLALAGRLPRTYRRLQARLTPQPAAVRTARDLAAEACHAWRLPEVRQHAQRIMSELAANAVDHARTDAVATVADDGTRLHLTVRDGDIRYPRFTATAIRRPTCSTSGAGGCG